MRPVAPALALLVTLSLPATGRAQVPVLDRGILAVDTDRSALTGQISRTDTNRNGTRAAVTCALYRPARRQDPVAAARSNPQIAALVRRIARQEGVDENEFLALVYQESRFNPCARSSAGAIGLAQLMPATAASLGVEIYDIEDNLRGGARYYRRQLDRHGGNVALALAAYNAGPGNVSKHGGIPPFRETQSYVRSITQRWLPALGGSDTAALPRSFGDSGAGFVAMRDKTLTAMGVSAATGASLTGARRWYETQARQESATVLDSWDLNLTARSGNLAMMNQIIALAASMADLIGAETAITASSLSGSARSSSRPAADDRLAEGTSPCEGAQGLVWDEQKQACVAARENEADLRLMLQAQ
ncbi:MAG: lytic transglycosylase domain-containing protein [Pseudomonadota bacterium]|nr:lytic transglycosylase domain-containing protein [Pseudomonadota bacterium]